MKLDVTRGAPDPEDAGRRLERIMDAASRAGCDLDRLPDDAALIVTHACQRAPYLATLLVRDPTRLGRVAASPYLRREKPAEVMAEELALALEGCPDSTELHRGLRRYRADELVRLGVRELGLGNPVEVGRELSHLAGACFDAALGFHDARLRARHGPPRFVDDSGIERDAELVVMGMGKLGGQELNFSSDVDVIYIYSSDAGSAGELSLHEYFSKLCKALGQAIGQVTEDDVVFRVDLRLRPEGSQGPIANSLPSTERYYETWGRPWERQAWLKARPCAGSRALGREVMDMMRPFVYPRSTSASIIDEVMELNRRIKAELDSSGVASGFDVKNGVGGIREIEFFAQALQLIHAGHKPALRARSTLLALDQLFFAGLVTESEHRALVHAYRYLRHAEHVLQLDSGRQTQRLPSDPAALAVLAKRLGHDSAEEFVRVLESHTGEVARLFATLGDPEAGVAAEAAEVAEIRALLSGDLDEARELAILAGLGFRDPEKARHELDVARKKPLSPLGPNARGAPARVAPGLMAEISTSPDPDQALRFASELISRRPAWASVWRLFDENPAIMRLVVSLFGTSSFLAKRFVNHPELIDVLVDIGRGAPGRSAEKLGSELDAHMAGVDAHDEGEAWNRLAEFKNAQLLRIGLADVGGELDAEAVSQELSLLAEVCLERALCLVSEAMVARHGVPRVQDGAPATLSICALGKLGARELGYASDLDVIFVYAQQGQAEGQSEGRSEGQSEGQSEGPRSIDDVTYMTRLAQRLMRGLHAMHPGGRLYELDTRLRPAGSQGLLVSTLAAWRNYHRGQARLWERQALIKLRPVAGDAALGAEVARAAAEYVYGHAPGQAGHESAQEIAAGIMAMRDKIERELAASARENDLKAGRGGLIDIEFASQYLQLVHGHDHPAMRTRSTVKGLQRAAELGLADPGDCALLVDAYRRLRKLEHRMRMVHDRSEHTLPRDPVELDKLARRAGHASGAALRADCEHWTREIRRAYQRILAA